MSPSYLRLDTEIVPKTDKVIEEDRQQFIACLAIRGEGKSYLLEGYSEEAFLKGYLILDLHGADNLENAFYIFPNNDPEQKHPIAIPITLISQETIRYDQKEIDLFNSRPMTEAEWYKMFPYATNHKLYNFVYPPMISFKKPLVQLEIIPHVTSPKGDIPSEANQKAVEKLTQVILDCRDKRRVFVLNRKMFANEKQYYWIMELIIRNIPDIADKYFIRKEPSDVGVKTREEMKSKDRNWHRIMIVTRELGELCPSRNIKADKSGESLSTKKAFLEFVRKARHTQIDWIADWQRNNDVDDSIRDQVDKWLFKRYNSDLGGDDKKRFFDLVDYLRNAIIEKFGPIKGGILARSWYPKIEQLNPKYHYLWIAGEVHVKQVRKLRHLHKEPWHKFWKLTGITFSHDYSKVQSISNGTESKESNNELISLYILVNDMKNPQKGKKKTNKEILVKLSMLQKENKIKFHIPFEQMSAKALSTYFDRWKKIYHKNNA